MVGPLNIFSAVQGVEVLWLAEQAGPVSSVTGSMTVVAQHSLSQLLPGPRGAPPAVPPPTWLLVPGGVGARREVRNDALLAALTALLTCPGCGLELCMSVCTGVTLLAAAGLLDGTRATGNKSVWEWVTSVRPAVQVRRTTTLHGTEVAHVCTKICPSAAPAAPSCLLR